MMIVNIDVKSLKNSDATRGVSEFLYEQKTFILQRSV